MEEEWPATFRANTSTGWAQDMHCGVGRSWLLNLQPRPLSPFPKHPNLQRAEDVDALLLGMASQIAEREDHVVVEDVLGEAEAIPSACALLVPGWGFCWSSRVRAERVPGAGNLHSLTAERPSDHGSLCVTSVPPGAGWSLGPGLLLLWWP